MAKWDESSRQKNWDKITMAVDSTKGKIITYEGKPIDAFFHSNSGGKTETVSNVWGGSDLPYLQSVQTAGEEGYTQYESEVQFTKDELIDKIKTKYPEIELNLDEENNVQIIEYTNSGRVKTIKFGNVQMAGTEARTLLGLKSTNFTFEINDNKIKFKVLGYGHGVGMSQTGADSMAKSGSKAEDIIKHFYSGVEITYVNDL
jgi:stage II sporulation protein D